MNLPLINLQREINKKLNEIKIGNKDIGIYDKVKKDSKLPFIKLSNLTFSGDKTKTSDRVIVNQSLEIWSDYQGKKEVLEILTEVINKISELEEMDLNKEQYIFDVKISEGDITEVQEFYKGYVSIKFIID